MGIPPPLFLVRIQSRLAWPHSPSISLSHSQVSSLETILSSVCEVTSWLDWWLSTCGRFREHLTDEERGNFERLMLSGSRALEFLGGQGITALGNLVLSRRNSLLLDVRSTVPAEEVARLRYADLPSSSGLFPSTLLDSALSKMRAASNNALVQWTLHPLQVPRKSSAGPSKAGSSSASSAARGGASPVVPRSQKQASMAPSSSSTQQGRKGRVPFSVALATPVANARVPGRSPLDRVPPLLRVGGCLSVPWRHWRAIGAESWVLSVLRDGYRIPFRVSPPLARTPISFPTDMSGRISSVTGLVPGGREDVVHRFIGNRPRFGSRLLQLSFPDRRDSGGLASCDRPLSPERVCSANSMLLSLRVGDFLASVDLSDAYFLHTRSSGIEEALVVLVRWGSLPAQGPVLWTVDCPSGLHQCVFAEVSTWAPSHGIPLLGYLDG